MVHNIMPFSRLYIGQHLKYFGLFLVYLSFIPSLSGAAYSQQQLKALLLASYQYTSGTDFVLDEITQAISMTNETPYRQEQMRLFGHQGALRSEKKRDNGSLACNLTLSPPAVGRWLWAEEKSLMGGTAPAAMKIIFFPSWTSNWMLAFYAMTLPPRLNSGTYAISEVYASGRSLWKLTVTYPDYGVAMGTIPLPHLFCDNELFAELRDGLRNVHFPHATAPITLEGKQWMITKADFYRSLELAKQCYIKSAELLIDHPPHQPMLYGITFYNRNGTILYSQKWERVTFLDTVNEQLFLPPIDCEIISIRPDYSGSDIAEVFNRPPKMTFGDTCNEFSRWFGEWFGNLARQTGSLIFHHGSLLFLLTGAGLLIVGGVMTIQRKK